MILAVAPGVLSFMRQPGRAHPLPTDWPDLAPIRQIWLPNSSHLDMLHHLAYAYTFTQAGSDSATLRAVGRLCSWLFREAHRPGEQHVAVATAALRQAFTFPAQLSRQGHLGYLLAWLATNGGRSEQQAAAEEAG